MIFLRYNGSICAKCGKVFGEHDEVVVCPRCGTPEHKDCWIETNTCVNENQHEAGFLWQDTQPKRPAHQAPVAEQNGAPAPPPSQTQTCPSCGTMNDIGEPVCTRCGQRLYLNAAGDPNAYNPQVNSPFGKKGFHYGYAQANFKIDGIPAAEMASYIQQNSDVYLTKFLYMDNKNTKNGFNWAGAFFPFLWLMYRKMYKTGLIVLGVFLLLGAMTITKAQAEAGKESLQILRSFLSGELTPEEAVTATENLPPVEITTANRIVSYISLSLRMAVCLYVATKGDGMYRKKAVKDILEIREQAGNSETYFALLSKKGGGSVGAMIGTLVLYTALTLGIEQLAIFFLV